MACEFVREDNPRALAPACICTSCIARHLKLNIGISMKIIIFKQYVCKCVYCQLVSSINKGYMKLYSEHNFGYNSRNSAVADEFKLRLFAPEALDFRRSWCFVSSTTFIANTFC